MEVFHAAGRANQKTKGSRQVEASRRTPWEKQAHRREKNVARGTKPVETGERGLGREKYLKRRTRGVGKIASREKRIR